MNPQHLPRNTSEHFSNLREGDIPDNPAVTAVEQLSLAQATHATGRQAIEAAAETIGAGERQVAKLDDVPAVVVPPRPSRKPPTDWERVERFYRTGLLSIREIAKQAGVSEGAIRKKAKANGWERDLTAKVREKVRTELVRAEVRTPGEVRATEREIVEQAATTIVHVVREHRRDIRQARRAVERMLAALEADADLKLPAQAATLRDLTMALKTLVTLEREAFSVDEPPSPAGGDAGVTKLDALLAKIRGTDAPAAS